MPALGADRPDSQPAWLWDPALQRAAWANLAAESLFPGLTSAGPLPPADPAAALSNACHATLGDRAEAEFGPLALGTTQVRCRASPRALAEGGPGLLIELTEIAPALPGSEGSDMILSRAAHDLRAPLTAIIGFAEFMAHSGDSMPLERRREYLDDIIEAGRYAARMAEDLLTYAAARPARRMVADLTQIARRAARHLAIEAERRDVALNLILAPTEAAVVADPDQILRAVSNLAGNAVAHAAREVALSLSTWPDGGLSLTVRDDGPGLSPEELSMAMQPFGRLGKGGGGAGLGLPIALRFAEANGAGLEIETAPGAGFSASLVFPAALRL